MAQGPFDNVERNRPASMFPVEGETPDYPQSGDPLQVEGGTGTMVEMSDEELGATPEEDNFDIVEEEDGGATITFNEGEKSRDISSIGFGSNLAEVLDKTDLSSISKELQDLIEEDLASREEWEKTYQEGLGLLGLTYEDRTEPFNGATGVTHPMLNEATTQFQAQA